MIPAEAKAIPCDLSIVIINWNSREYIRQCIKSIQFNTVGLNYEIIVVDNASYDRIEDLLLEEFPKVKFIQSLINLGFAKGNNLGAKHCSGKHLIFLNPDTVLIGNALGIILRKTKKLKNVGATGPRLLNSDLSVQKACVQRFPTIFRQIFFTDIVFHYAKNIKYFGLKPLYNRSDHPVLVEAVAGACICIRKEVFEKVGGFSEEYFMYTEDIDLCRKLIDNGYANYYIDSAEIIHYQGGSTKVEKQSDFSTVMPKEAVYRYFIKFKGELYARTYKFALMLNAILRIGFLISLNVLRRHKSNENIIASRRKWSRILRWSLGLETWVGKYALVIMSLYISKLFKYINLYFQALYL